MIFKYRGEKKKFKRSSLHIKVILPTSLGSYGLLKDGDEAKRSLHTHREKGVHVRGPAGSLWPDVPAMEWARYGEELLLWSPQYLGNSACHSIPARDTEGIKKTR